MKIAYFTESLPPNVDGVSRTYINLVETLESENIDYKFYSPFKPDSMFSWSRNVRKILSIPFLLYSDYRVSIPYFHNLYRELDNFRPDLVHVVSPTLLGLYALKYAKKRNLKAVSSYHTNFISYFTYYGFSKKLEELGWGYLRWFYNQFMKTYVPSSVIVEELAGQGIKNTELWQRGVDIERFSPDFRSRELRESLGVNGKPLLLFVSRLVKEKDLDDLVAADRILRSKGYSYQLALAGDGPMKEELKHKLPEAVFPGFLSGKDLSRWYASADLFLFPSTTETFGNVVLEALASGLPSVVVDKGGVRDIVTDGQDGLIAKSNSPSDFSRKIESLLNNRETMVRMAREARVKAQNFCWSSINRRLLNSYTALMYGDN